jgi:hypothetical protein
MDVKDIPHDSTDRYPRIKRRVRILKDHGDAIASDAAHVFVAEGEQIGIFKDDVSLFDPARRLWDQTLNGKSRYGLATSGFTDQTEDLL